MSDVPLRIESLRTQAIKLRLEGAPTPAEARWLAENRPRTRGDCVDGPRPCPWSSCRHNLGLDVQRDGTIAFVDGLQDSCSLDVADRNVGVGVSPKKIGELTGRTRQSSDQILAGALIHLRAISDENPLIAKALRSSGGLCALCPRRSVGWLPLCLTHARAFGNSPHARKVLENQGSMLESLAGFTRDSRRSKGP